MNKKIITGAVSAAVLSLSGVVYADTTSDLVNALVTKGVLTEEEGALLSKGHDKKKANTPVLTNKGGKFKLQSADGKNEIALTGRMHFDYRNSDLDENDFGDGDGHNEEYDIDGKSTSASEFEMRRARIGIKGKLDGMWKYDVVLNANGKSGNNLDTASLTWAAMKPFQIQVGRFKQAFNLEGLTSSNDIDFNERSFMNQISPHKKLGIAFKGTPTKGMTYAVTKYQEGYKNNVVEEENNYSGRLTYNWAEANKIKDSIFHVGIAGFTEDYSQKAKTSSNGNSAQSAYSVTQSASSTVTSVTGGTDFATTHSRLFKFKSAGRGYSPLAALDVQGEYLTGGGASEHAKSAVHHENRFAALEGIFAKGPFKLQAEYGRGKFEGKNEIQGNGAEADVEIGYISANYILTGEHYSKSYKGGKMKGIKVKNPFDFEKGTGTGAFEIGARYEYLGIDDAKVTNVSGYDENRARGAWDCPAGTSAASGTSATYGTGTGATGTLNGCDLDIHQYTIGLKWIANPNVLAKVSLTYSDYGEDLIAPDFADSGESFDSETLLQTRVQWMF
jgi:phosphate-selective porin OprO/OprP